MGNRFIATRVKNASRTDEVKKALSLLQKARVCYRVSHTSGNGLPLGAESNEKIFKVLLLDVGFAAIQLGLSRLNMKEAACIGDLLMRGMFIFGRAGLPKIAQSLETVKTSLKKLLDLDIEMFYASHGGAIPRQDVEKLI